MQSIAYIYPILYTAFPFCVWYYNIIHNFFKVNYCKIISDLCIFMYLVYIYLFVYRCINYNYNNIDFYIMYVNFILKCIMCPLPNTILDTVYKSV